MHHRIIYCTFTWRWWSILTRIIYTIHAWNEMRLHSCGFTSPKRIFTILQQNIQRTIALGTQVISAKRWHYTLCNKFTCSCFYFNSLSLKFRMHRIVSELSQSVIKSYEFYNILNINDRIEHNLFSHWSDTDNVSTNSK